MTTGRINQGFVSLARVCPPQDVRNAELGNQDPPNDMRIATDPGGPGPIRRPSVSTTTGGTIEFHRENPPKDDGSAETHGDGAKINGTDRAHANPVQKPLHPRERGRAPRARAIRTLTRPTRGDCTTQSRVTIHALRSPPQSLEGHTRRETTAARAQSRQTVYTTPDRRPSDEERTAARTEKTTQSTARIRGEQPKRRDAHEQRHQTSSINKYL